MNALRRCPWPTLLAAIGLAAGAGAAPSPQDPAVGAINALGRDLLPHAAKPDDNALISPYSIQSALAMAYAGAAGATRDEMARALHYPEDDAVLHAAFSALRADLEQIVRDSEERVRRARERGRRSEPIVLSVAHRLFGQQDFEFREPFLALLRDRYRAPLQGCDFRRNAARETEVINEWVAGQTRRRIENLIPPDALNETARLVLVNAIYLKAPWQNPFRAENTQPRPFRVRGDTAADVPTLFQLTEIGCLPADGYTALSLPYAGRQLHLLILLPDAPDGWKDLERGLTPALLAAGADLPRREVRLYLPKFRLQPPLMPLGKALIALGMKSAFNQPVGSADFSRMAPRRPDDDLYLSEVFHRTFLNLDEYGTEAAAATAVVMLAESVAVEKPPPIEVRVDRPFLFAIQHRASGACLFLGRVTDPR